MQYAHCLCTLILQRQLISFFEVNPPGKITSDLILLKYINLSSFVVFLNILLFTSKYIFYLYLKQSLKAHAVFFCLYIQQFWHVPHS